MHVESRLLAIPIIFVMLRIWGTIQFIISITTSSMIMSHNGCISVGLLPTFKVFGILQVSCFVLVMWSPW